MFKLLLEMGFEEEEVVAIIEEFPPILGLPVQHQILPVLDYLEVFIFYIFLFFCGITLWPKTFPAVFGLVERAVETPHLNAQRP